MDFFSPEIRRNPFPVYDRLRTAAPVLHEPGFDAPQTLLSSEQAPGIDPDRALPVTSSIYG